MLNTKSKKVVLSFDVSSVSTGWAVIKNNKPIAYGKITIEKCKSLSEKLFFFRTEVILLICKYKPTDVVVEDTYLLNVKTLKTLMQFIGILNESYFNLYNKTISIVSPNTVRSKFKLKGKEAVFNFIESKYSLGLDFDCGNDITDAILQGLYYYKFLMGEYNER